MTKKIKVADMSPRQLDKRRKMQNLKAREKRAALKAAKVGMVVETVKSLDGTEGFATIEAPVVTVKGSAKKAELPAQLLTLLGDAKRHGAHDLMPAIRKAYRQSLAERARNSAINDAAKSISNLIAA